MQVTLDQNEIETGIRLYLDTQFKINEGQEITIDMKAGRGENGFTATIDIVPVGTVKQAAAPATTGKNPLGLAEKTARTAAPAQAAAQEPAQESAQAAAAETSTQAEGQTEEGQETAAQEGDEAPAARPSLFAGLAKPKNS